MPTRDPGILQGTLDLMVLRTLETMGPQHGFGLAKRIQQISGAQESQDWERTVALMQRFLRLAE